MERAEPSAGGPDPASELAARDEARDAEEDMAAAVCVDALYRAESARLLRSLARRTANRDEARDLVQEIFARIARIAAAQPLRLERPRSYLGRMAANLLKDRRKAASRHMAERHISVDVAILKAPDQQSLLESRDMLRRIEVAMLRLPSRTREIFMAHRVEGLTYSEIAERTGLSIKAVEKQMSKAILQLDNLVRRA